MKNNTITIFSTRYINMESRLFQSAEPVNNEKIDEELRKLSYFDGKYLESIDAVIDDFCYGRLTDKNVDDTIYNKIEEEVQELTNSKRGENEVYEKVRGEILKNWNWPEEIDDAELCRQITEKLDLTKGREIRGLSLLMIYRYSDLINNKPLKDTLFRYWLKAIAGNRTREKVVDLIRENKFHYTYWDRYRLFKLKDVEGIYAIYPLEASTDIGRDKQWISILLSISEQLSDDVDNLNVNLILHDEDVANVKFHKNFSVAEKEDIDSLVSCKDAYNIRIAFFMHTNNPIVRILSTPFSKERNISAEVEFAIKQHLEINERLLEIEKFPGVYNKNRAYLQKQLKFGELLKKLEDIL